MPFLMVFLELQHFESENTRIDVFGLCLACSTRRVPRTSARADCEVNIAMTFAFALAVLAQTD